MTAEQEGGHKTSGFEDSDDELDSALKLKSKASKSMSPAGDQCHHQFHEVVITDTAFATYQACLVWIASGHISFSPLSSTRRVGGIDTPARSAATSSADLDAPHKVSPKSIYRLAHLLSLADLQALALKSFASRLTTYRGIGCL